MRVWPTALRILFCFLFIGLANACRSSTPMPLTLAATASSSPTLTGTSTAVSAVVSPTSTHALPRLTDTPTPTQTLLPTVTPTVTPSPTPSPNPNPHLVVAGETLSGIAEQYGVAGETIRSENAMFGDAILAGQMLWVSPTLPVTQTIPWHFSTVEGNLLEAYPAGLDTERFSLHYTPGTYPSYNPQVVTDLVTQALAHTEAVFSTTLSGRFDVYVAGTLFEPPDQALRGRSLSLQRCYFFLHDGTGDAADQQYIAAHELTHLFTWNAFGLPVSVLLSEGAAVYNGMTLIAGSSHIPLNTFCAAYLQAGELPVVSGSLKFEGHIYYLENYYAAGCFVGFLIEEFGVEKFGQLYPTANYEVVYGQTIFTLEEAWRARLAEMVPIDSFDPAVLVKAVDAVEEAYQSFFPTFRWSETQVKAYYELDQARLALLEGRFEEVEQYLERFRER